MPVRHRTRAPDSGFVLIGVVVFVLALTILVFSLYGLSSYEAQFFQRSLDEEQAFQSAVGGIERAKCVLMQTSLLRSVADSLPVENVTAAVAIQAHGSVSDSVGDVNWQGADVTIRVTAEVNDARRTIEGNFTPRDSVALSYYSSLLTVSEGIEVDVASSTGPSDRSNRVLLGGPVWESSSQDTNSWKPLLCPPAPLGIRKSPAVPVPDVAPFLTHPGKIDQAVLPVVSGPASNQTYLLDAGPGLTVRYFDTPDDDVPFNLFPYGCQVQVRGLAVWLMPHGINRIFEAVKIDGLGGQDCLVIIAGAEGITFWGGLQASIPVVLVSSGQVVLYHGENDSGSSSTVDLAIFALSARFMGPGAPFVLPLIRDPAGPLNSLGGNPGYLDALAGQGALPNASSGGRRLDLVPGTWHASSR